MEKEVEVMIFDISKKTTVPWYVAGVVIDGYMDSLDVSSDIASDIIEYIEGFFAVRVVLNMDGGRAVELVSEPEPVPLVIASNIVSSARRAKRIVVQPPRASALQRQGTGLPWAKIDGSCYMLAKRFNTVNLSRLFKDMMEFISASSIGSQDRDPWAPWARALQNQRFCGDEGLDVISVPQLQQRTILLPYAFIDLPSIIQRAERMCGGNCRERLVEAIRDYFRGGDRIAESLLQKPVSQPGDVIKIE